MVKIGFAMAVVAMLITSAKAEGVNVAQVDMRTGLHFDQHDPSYDSQRRAYESGAVVGVSGDARPKRRAVQRLPAGASRAKR
ncbi:MULTISPECIES: hypothetical protein [Bradyrhizobium]|uniref:hypothetical protein n=1 Tax=Bradyrhizobium elkanii TaxID=29448 RepID=UPI0004806E20|nr:hypothetical protein [Bradyrhizobium elkanii]